MNEETGLSVNVSIDPATGFKRLPDLVAFDVCKAYAVPGGNLLLRNTRTGKRAMVMPDVYSALLRCEQFRTLDEHVARIIESNPGMQGQHADMRKVLQSLLDSGMLLTAKSAGDRLTRSIKQAATERQTDRPVVVIITWERPAALERLLKSIHSNCDTEKFHQLYIVDDSRKSENINKNRDLTAKFAIDTKTSIQYFGQTQQQSLLKNLSRQLPQHEEAIRFLADQSQWHDQWTSGLARNIALLLSSGHRLVMLDDDTICDVYDPIRPKADIAFSDTAREADFFQNEQEWLSLRIPVNHDPVERHMQCLGLSLSESLNVLGKGNLKPGGFAGADASLVANLKPESPVLVTECGSYGCPGTNTNTWLPDMAPVSIKQMLASTQKTKNALGTRMVWTGRSQPHFSTRPNMSQITGFDNREMLPPYFPILRGEDRLFGYLLNFIYPSSVTLDYPWAIPHLPIPKRDWQESDSDFTPKASFPMFFLEKVLDQKSSCNAEKPIERMAAIAAVFDDLAAASEDVLLANHRDYVLQDLSGQMRNLDDLLNRADSLPEEWQNYLQQGKQQLSKGLEQACLEDFPLKGLPQSLQGEALLAFWRKSWRGYAAALLAWPDIRQAAAEIVDA